MPIFRETRLAERGRIDGAIRVVDGDFQGLEKKWAGLSGAWVFGVATLSQGKVEFAGCHGLRFFKRRVVEIAIESLGIPRRASVGELCLFGPFTRVIPLETRGATLEWEIHSLRVDWAVDHDKPSDVL